MLDAFIPLLTVSISWKDAEAEYGNTINPSKTKRQPELKFIDAIPSIWQNKDDMPQLTIAMTDPDAPSRDNPEWSEFCHWIATEVPLTKPDSDKDDDDDLEVSSRHSKGMVDIMPYKKPGPPPKTGKHRYVFAALVPINMTTEKLNLTKPTERQHWGFEYERDGLRFWAEEHELKVIGE